MSEHQGPESNGSALYWKAIADFNIEALAIERKRVDLLLGQLTLKSTDSVSLVEIPEPDVPPDAVMVAMKAISPIRDKTFEANWTYWEANKERARQHPDAFAEEILEGAVFEVPAT